jgi:single-strand DNA-binding protein
MNKVKNNTEEPKAAPLYQNQVRLVGFLGADPVQHENRAIFSLATKVSWKPDQDSDEWESLTQWHHCVAWGKLAEALRPLVKGDHILVEGELRTSTYDKELPVVGGGTTIVPTKVWEIRARAVRKLARKQKPVAKAAKAKPLKAAA